jgi:primase-polymerase (primpol)-like protein
MKSQGQTVDYESQAIAKIEAQMGPMVQTIAKLEVQMGQMANTLNIREEGKLPSQPVANPKGHYMAEASTSHHQQVLAITTLRSRRRVDNHVQENEDEHIESPQNLQKEKGKQVSTEASSSSAPTPEIPYEPQAPFLERLKAPSHFGKQGYIENIGYVSRPRFGI